MNLQEKQEKIGYLLRKAQHSIRLKIDRALAEYDITLPQFAVLTVLSLRESAIHSADVARICMFSPQATNAIITNLDKMGLIARQAHETHGRMLTITLTEEGKKRLKLCRVKVDCIEAEMMKSLNAKEEKLIRAWLSHCIDL